MTPEAILHAVLFVQHLVQGPVELGAFAAAEKRGFLDGTRLSRAFRGSMVAIVDDPARTPTAEERIAATIEIVESTLEWQRFDAAQLSDRMLAAL